MQAGLRQRKYTAATAGGNKPQSPVRQSDVQPRRNNDHFKASRRQHPSLWRRLLLRGVLFLMATVIAIAYIVYNHQDIIFNKYLPYIYLQHPELINRFIPLLRPALLDSDKRQVLIVGTMSSGTRQVVSDLQRRLSLEISHEASDASQYLVRDGTVSWFHGIRFLDKKSSEIIRTFCQYPTTKVGFHPRFYDYSACDASQQWSPCWASACERVLQQEWGCARRKEEDGNDCSAFQPFHTTLHQVRNPLHTVESLIVKFCGGGGDGWKRSGFAKVHRLLFDDNHGSSEDDTTACWGTVIDYVIQYTRAMLKAQQDGLINATYSIETTSVCSVAELAGFTTPETVVYPPNQQKIRKRCRQDSNNHEAMTPKTRFQVNKGRIRIKAWSDLPPAAAKDLQSLMADLGYDPSKIPEMTE